MSPEGEGEPSLPKLLAALALGARAVNGLPMGKSGGDENDGSDHDDDDDEEDGMAEDEFAYQSAFPEFSSLCGTARRELAQLLQLVLDMENDASNNDDAAMWERAADLCDSLLEDVESHVQTVRDKASGVTTVNVLTQLSQQARTQSNNSYGLLLSGLVSMEVRHLTHIGACARIL
eukprot:scaffold12806_cov55-Attheya_sp.AAC.2